MQSSQAHEERKRQEYEKGRQQAAEAIEGAKDLAHQAKDITKGMWIFISYFWKVANVVYKDKAEEAAEQAKGVTGYVVDTIGAVVGGKRVNE